MPVNLLTGTANRGNLPSCSCVLRETLETVETADSISLTFSLWLWSQKQPATWGEREEAKPDDAQNFAPPESLWSFKGHWQNPRYHNWTRPVEINTAAYIRGLHESYFIFHLLHAVSDKKNPSISERYELSISQPFLLSLRLLLSCLFSSLLPWTHNSFPTLC